MLHFRWLNCSFVSGPFSSGTLWIPSMAFPLFEVSGSSELRKVIQSTEVHKDKAVWLSALKGSWGGWNSKQKEKEKNPNVGLFFSSFFEVQFCFLYFLIFILCFYLCPSCFQQGLEVLKTLWKVCSVDISNRTGGESMTYELLPLWCPITKAESRECKAWMYQACISSRGTAKIKELLMGISKDK